MALDDEILDEFNNEPNKSSEDELHMGLRVLSFCIPIAGAIIYFTTDSNLKNNIKHYCWRIKIISVSKNSILELCKRV